MCDLKTNIRHLLSDGSYCEQCECGWISARYILKENNKEFIKDLSGNWISIEKSEEI